MASVQRMLLSYARNRELRFNRLERERIPVGRSVRRRRICSQTCFFDNVMSFAMVVFRCGLFPRVCAPLTDTRPSSCKTIASTWVSNVKIPERIRSWKRGDVVVRPSLLVAEALPRGSMNTHVWDHSCMLTLLAPVASHLQLRREGGSSN